MLPGNKPILVASEASTVGTMTSIFDISPFFSKDMSVVWIKNLNGEIKSYELNEIKAKDEKDIKIEYLQAEIEELKKGIRNNEYESTAIINGTASDTNKSQESPSISKIARTNKKSK